ncbi:hypothetical protein [Streptomyces goshikiensis]|uniref:hypothetical protein n=1 Tax=Streptomyces goshikiensis TaxID=1942 RepID=UPI00368CD416
MTEYGFDRASDEVIIIRNSLADRVIEALKCAGLPAFREREEGVDGQDGAVIRVEPDAETISAAVSVGWRCDASQISAALKYVTSGFTDTPNIHYPGRIGLRMQLPIIRTLLSSGIIATPSDDDMNPDHILVFGQMSDLPPGLRPSFVPPNN